MLVFCIKRTMISKKKKKRTLAEKLRGISYLESLGLTPETIEVIEDAIDNPETVEYFEDWKELL